MRYLVAVTLLWAFSFSLIGVYLAGQVDAWFSVFIRVLLATCVFIPFLKPFSTPKPLALKLMAIGAVQLGVMYGFYYHSFLYLSVPEVLLFTVMTPLYITLLNDLLEKTINGRFLLVAFIATLGAVAIRYQNVDDDFLFGFLLVQGANICFATGQVFYKRVMQSENIEQSAVFVWFFMGALIVASTCFVLFGNFQQLPTTVTQWGVLIYLGVIASGVGYFAWNKGVVSVNVGAIAVMNNVLIPAGIIVNVLIWNRDADLLRLSSGGAVIVFALWLNHFLARSK
jgi:carboxylate/amino acid/amine transporter